MPVASCGFTGHPGRLIDTGPELQVELTNPWALDERPHACKALIDTGANHCFVSGRVADDLRLEQFDTEDFRGAGGRFASPRYLVHLRIPQLATRASILLARLPDADQIGRSVLLGRDFLQFYRLVYDGPTGDVTLQVSS
ncbi:MAG: retropepsin-like aspartic protease [Chloroflexota bacterium]|nr:retropepsin-like aspartic protease [Chloroflexota bacterium]MDE2918926.1 retropepsin-like aspartic protease [Chloroflexota bacterium]